ncbi:hypothetical protein GCM10023149_28830 [Mucilaginibacter gynuensis]|uniref:HTH cro/C1-type domain-containing protein n=1 Tax=Mucilaginibacter gynuensis TaxID=1302236 RepID=A0ABP8GLG1_9SPHI
MTKRAELYSDNITLKNLGVVLKEQRMEKGFSLDDMVQMTGFPKSTILNIEKGSATNISYYIAYGQAVDFSILVSDIKIKLKSRYELSPDRKSRKFLTLKIRSLYKEDFFSEKKAVHQVIEKLISLHKFENSKELSSSVSGILRNFVEDDLLELVEKKGRNNIYIKKANSQNA